MSDIRKIIDEIQKTITRSINPNKGNFGQCIIDIAQNVDGKYYYWPLCLDDKRKSASLEADICSTCYCVSSLLMEERNNISHLIEGGLATILKLRNKEGIWPTVVKKEEFNGKAKELSCVAISDCVFSITTLLDADFLAPNLNTYLEKAIGIASLKKELSLQKNRINYIFKTVDFLNDKKTAHPNNPENFGWDYTYNIDNSEEEKPRILTTLNVVKLLIRIYVILSKQECTKETEDKLNEIKKMISGGVSFILSANLFDQKKENIVYLCKMVDTFIECDQNQLRDEDDLKDDIIKAIGYIASVFAKEEEYKKYFANTYLYSERFQLDLEKGTSQNVLHESFPESIILTTLINGLIQMNDVEDTKLEVLISIKNVLNSLKIQKSMDQHYMGLFRSHIRRNDGDCPVYVSAESYKAIMQWARFYNDYQKFIGEVQPENIDGIHSPEALDYLQKQIKDFIGKHYGESVYETTITYLNAVLKKLEEIRALNDVSTTKERLKEIKEEIYQKKINLDK